MDAKIFVTPFQRCIVSCKWSNATKVMNRQSRSFSIFRKLDCSCKTLQIFSNVDKSEKID